MLSAKTCLACEGGVQPLDKHTIAMHLQTLPGWSLNKTEPLTIQKNFHFKDYYQVMSFVNAVAWIAHQENHHPDLTVSYADCTVSYTTHAIKGLSENDFICAAKIEALYGYAV